jgi:hypothetical protein
MHVAMADGTVRKVEPTISLPTWTYLVKARDGGVLGDDW